jgi:hypothetical protein
MHRFLRAFLLTSTAACSGSVTRPAPSDTGSFAAQFDAVWERYDSTYPYFEYKRVNWDSLRAVYRPRAVGAASQDALAATVRDLLAELRDVHAWLVQPDGHQVNSWDAGRFVNWRFDVWQDHMRRNRVEPQPSNWGTAAIGGVPYLYFGAWNTAQFGSAAVDALLERFRDAPAMIIDVRMNGGGSDALAFAVAGRFFDAVRIVSWVAYRDGPRHTDIGPLQARTVAPRGAWQFRRPVLLLVGRGCFSSTENFILAMRELPNVTVVGDTTGGGSGNPATFALGGGWSYSVPRWIEYTPQGEVVEWNGIAPRTVIAATAADFAAGRDPVLDYAAAWAQRSPGWATRTRLSKIPQRP